MAFGLAILFPANSRSAADCHTSIVETYEFTTPSDTVITSVDSMTVALADSIANLPTGDDIIETAKNFIGVRYRLGHTGPKLFDCSGFTSYVYRQKNIEITRTSRSQYAQGKIIKSIADLQKGDLVFFGGRQSTRSVGHVGIVTDVDPDNKRFKFIHASRTGVQIDTSTSSYYARRYLGARRILDTEE